MWLVIRGALTGDVTVVHKYYCAPVFNMGAGVMVLENMC